MKKKTKLIILFIVLIVLGIISYLVYKNVQEEKYRQEKLKEEEYRLEQIKNSYNNYVKTNKEANLYNDNYEVSGRVSNNMYLELEEITDYSNEYFKIKNSNLYIKYVDIEKVEKKENENIRYKNYIPFNKSIVTDDKTKLYVDDNKYYIINENINLPIIVDDTDKYYSFYNDKLVYVNKSDATVIESDNSTLEKAEKISVLNYHFVINLEAGEDKLCEPLSICHTDTQFSSHMNYIKENGFYTITMKELEMFIDGKINLPKKSVSITIDDGWFVERTIKILEEYDVMGTLFLIGSLAPVSAYNSPNLEVHSHTWNMHNVSNCTEGRSPLLCYDKVKLVEDFKQSRESLNNTTYFCYPFYEYNNHTISALKEAGFTMALAGQIGDAKVRVGIDKFKVPRFVIHNTTTVDSLAAMIN